MKHVSITEARAFFKGKLNEAIDAAEADSSAVALFITYHKKSKAYALVLVGDGYRCRSMMQLLDEVRLSGGDVVAFSAFPGREPAQDFGASASEEEAHRIMAQSTERERQLAIREKRIEKMEQSLRRRESDLVRTEEELKRIAEQHMEDAARDSS